MKQITREHTKVDRIACPWLIKNFVDENDEFLFVPPHKVLEIMRIENVIPFYIPNEELGHHGDKCSLYAIIKKYELDKKNPELLEVAKIIRVQIQKKGTLLLNHLVLLLLQPVLVLYQRIIMTIWQNNFLFMMHYTHLLNQIINRKF